MSHGVPRVAATPVSQEQRLKEETAIAEYKSLESSLQQKVAAKDFSPETFELSSKLLAQNPEYYTIWNHRRRIHLASWAERGDDIVAIGHDIVSDLKFIFPLMVKYPKCYWIWNFRLWLLDQSIERLDRPEARTLWHGELALVAKMLAKDRRNFHGWRFRRIVVAALESDKLSEDGEPVSLTQQELDYTTKMIHIDLSNYSAWHYRSKLIPRLLSEHKASDEERRKMLDDELELIHEALIDPYDSSLWFYHQCLMAAMSPDQAAQSIAPSLTQADRLRYIEDEMAYVRDMLDGCDDCKWVFQALIELSRLHQSQSKTWPRGVQQADVDEWMSRLKQLDPMRRGRWQEFEAQA